jgi:hypothetical protein
MRTGVKRVRVNNRWAMLALALLACGGRTIDDGAYDVYSHGSDPGADPAGSCRNEGTLFMDGELIPGQLPCFCNNGQIECETPGGIASGGNTSSGGVSTGGTAPVAGSTSTGGAASTGGSTSTGGVSSAGATTGGGSSAGGGPICDFIPQAAGLSPLIDDMEDGDGYIVPLEGRSGTWFTYNDGTPSGSQFPFPGQAFSMQYAGDSQVGKFVANTSGVGFDTWGAGMGLVLNAGCPYDASVYRGVRFYAKAEQAMSVRLIIATRATSPPEAGGTCLAHGTFACYDAFQIPLMLGTAWQEERVLFTQLAQQGWGVPAAFDASTVIGINFQTIDTDTPFSYSVDSVSFY